MPDPFVVDFAAMWFKNIRLYRFTKPFDLSPETLEEKLAAHRFQPCSKHDKAKYGWVAPLGRHGDMLTHVTGNCMMICAQKQEKILPSSVVNEALTEKIEELEAKQGRKIFRKEKLQLKDDIIVTLLPQAFNRNQRIYAYISPKDDLMVVDSSSASKAEELLSFLRTSIETLPVIPPVSQNIPSDIMTSWLQQQAAGNNFEINQECELFNPSEEGNVIRCKGQDLESDEIQAHLQAGKQVKKLGILWNDALSCILENDLSIKRLKFEDMVLEKADEVDADNAAEQFDQDFAVMSLELSHFFNDLFAAFGGLQKKI